MTRGISWHGYRHGEVTERSDDEAGVHRRSEPRSDARQASKTDPDSSSMPNRFYIIYIMRIFDLRWALRCGLLVIVASVSPTVAAGAMIRKSFQP